MFGRYFHSGRLAEAAGDFPETARAANPMTMRAYDLGIVAKATFKARMDRAKADRGHIIGLVHNVVSSGASGGAINIADFAEIVDYAHTIGMPIRTLGEVRAAAVA